jgi:sensor histidine kinase YesM
LEGSFIEDFLGYMNLIHHIAINEDAKKTQQMIQFIANHIKYKFTRKNEIVMLKDELLQIDNLFEIFKVRFGTGLKVTNTIKDEYFSYYLPNYTVVAFVENALYHGLIPMDGAWNIQLSLDDGEEDFKIKIVDNGVGFDTEKLDLNENIIQYTNENIGSIADVIARLKKNYGNSGHVDIFSNNGSGTIVEITIPKL